mmetsp:Transcript_25170/g.32721  ORF Transcript_25170/g.32721 Transcript_25170/m.32721 type:complete len:177 (-) Transcript_25170:176-706(-)|eukprot:CAMPEP_0117799644 /NCGR_PEP_ID=MMETSP0948-20121206/13922_1 /TAXON_ID=44440 /ORGANISM="Chattonella subsalsa, Strain CCMP2191" /LENGTH=176 /DNA_ID=CAMNT_0005631621 /DNA_START=102 /DNA_END=632 /DNA_ORIENTATION=-
MFRVCCVILGCNDPNEEAEKEEDPLPPTKKDNDIVIIEEPMAREKSLTQAENFDLEKFMSKLEEGFTMTKFDRNLQKKQERIIFTPDRKILSWKPTGVKSSAKLQKSFPIKDIQDFRTSETQKPQTLGSVARCGANRDTAFQLALSGSRNIDLEASSVEVMNEFIEGLKLRKAQMS